MNYKQSRTEACQAALTSSLDRVCQNPVSRVVLCVIDETVLNESQVDAYRNAHFIKHG